MAGATGLARAAAGLVTSPPVAAPARMARPSPDWQYWMAVPAPVGGAGAAGLAVLPPTAVTIRVDEPSRWSLVWRRASSWSPS